MGTNDEKQPDWPWHRWKAVGQDFLECPLWVEAAIALEREPMDGHVMGEPISIDPQTGSISVGETRLKPLDTKAKTEPLIADLLDAPRFHENGYEWLYLRGLTFGGQPASMGLCFHDGGLNRHLGAFSFPMLRWKVAGLPAKP